MRYIVLGSGSKGNCSLLEYKKDHFICIDVGFCYKTFLATLNKYNIELDNIDYYFITHNHTDHIKMLCKVPNSKIYSYKKTISDYSYNILHKGVNDFIDFKVNVIRTSHDAPFSIGFIFNIGNKEIVYITDSGKIKNHYFKELFNKDYYILESNYDLDMLYNSSRPIFLKQRIDSDKGHLSNIQAIDYLNNFVGNNTKQIFFAHISQECNDPQILNNLCKNSLNCYGNVKLEILKQDDGRIFEL